MIDEQLQEETMQAIMGLILNGGNAKGHAMEALYAAKEGDFETAKQKLKESNESLTLAHNSQTSMLTREASGEHVVVNLLMVHAQDHMMNAITVRDLAGEVVEVYKKIAEK